MPTTDINNPSTSSPGAILRRCREYHGISLEEAAEATKIGENYLAALEGDQVTGFASLAYLKGFLRIYATHLGLNADDMIRLYEKMIGSPAQNGEHPESAGDGGVVGRRRFSWRKLVLPTGLLLLLIATSVILDRSSAPPSRQPSPSPGVDKLAAAPVQPVLSSVRAIPPVNEDVDTLVPAVVPKKEKSPPVAPSVAQPPVEKKGFIVRMKVLHIGAVAVIIDGSSAQNYELAVGDIIEWKADKIITLDLSNAGGVELELNGNKLQPLGPDGQPIYVTLDAEGVKF